MSEDVERMLGLLVAHESAISGLYAAYADAFVGYRDLWEALADEEQRHAESLKGLEGDPALAEWLTPEVRQRAQAFRSSIDYVEAQTSRAQQGDLTALQALVVAKDIEDALIDRLELMSAAPHWTEISQVVSELKEETGGHRQMLAVALKAAKEQGR